MQKFWFTVLAAGFAAASARGDVLGNAYDGQQTTGSLAQDFVFAGTDPLDSWVVSNFRTLVDYELFDIYSLGWTTNANNEDGEGANFDIWDGLPWEDGSGIVMSASDGYCTLGSNGTLGADFGGQLLPAGDYYMVFQSVYNFLDPGGLAIVFHTSIGDANDWEWNPGLGQGWGSAFREVVDGDSNPIDVNWQLNATPIPAPASLVLLMAGLALRRRR